jgi:hypothetical protein
LHSFQGQIHDLFDAARDASGALARRSLSGFSTVDEWVAAFKEKRAEIVNRRCAA